MAVAAAEALPEISSPEDATVQGRAVDSKAEWPEKSVPGPASIAARTVLEDPKVTLFTNFLSEAECEHLLSLAEGRWERSTVTRGYASSLLDGAGKSETETSADSEAKADSEDNRRVEVPAAATATSAVDEADASTTASTEDATPAGPTESSKDKDDRPANALHVQPDQEEERVVGKMNASVVPEKGQVLQVESKNRTSCSVIFQYGESPVLEQILARVAMVTGRPLECVERPVLVRYLPGQLFNEHHDGAVRPMTVFAYFNDVEGGGETYFPHLGFQVRPVAGTALMWPNVTEDGGADMRMIHQGLPPEKGVKYGINLFVNAHAQRDVSHIRVVQHKPPGGAA